MSEEVKKKMTIAKCVLTVSSSDRYIILMALDSFSLYLLIAKYFYAVYDFAGKVLARAIGILKENRG